MKIILAVDGGGIRGIIPAAVLVYLENKIQEITGDPRIRMGNMVDFVAGTSTGSIIGALMLIPDESGMYPKYKMSDIVDFYFDLGDKVFKTHFLHDIKTLWGLFGPRFPSSNIEEPLLKELNHYKLKDLMRPCMFSGYDIEKREVKFYTNKDDGQKYAEYYIKDVIRGSTSIPSYFAPAHFQYGVDVNTIVDGGVFVNNPSLAAYTEVSKTLFKGQYETRKYNPHDLVIISLGTGSYKQKSYLYKKTKNWGKAAWMLPVIDVLLTSHSEVTNYEMEKLFASYDSKHNYKRINVPIKIGSANAMDSSKENLTKLLKDVNQYIEDNKEMLNVLAREIVDLNLILKK
jgi:uncharacterized protein